MVMSRSTATRSRRPDQVLWEIEELPVLSRGTALFRMNRTLRVFIDFLTLYCLDRLANETVSVLLTASGSRHRICREDSVRSRH